MIMTVDELRQYINTVEEDAVLEDKLTALELLLRAYTNNNFQAVGYRCDAAIINGTFVADGLTPFEAGDTVQVSTSSFNDGLYIIQNTDASTFTVQGKVQDEDKVLVTKVVYPQDVKMGVVNMIRWDMDYRGKVGVSSETISRHSVSYFDMDKDNTDMGYPIALLGFLRPYVRARFGQGVRK